MATSEAALLRTLHDEHAGALWAYIVRLTGDRFRAEDVVQETLLRAWRHPKILEQGSSPRAWLFTVARRIVIDEWRADRGREIVSADPPERAVPDRTDHLVETEVMTSALRTLSAEHREVLLECFYRGASVADAAQRLGIPPGTVKSRTHYGLRALRTALEQMGAL